MQRIFISYARLDGSRVAELLYTRLQGAGYTVWKDDHDLRLGEPFVKAIAEAVEVHDHVLLLLSTASLTSYWVEYETLLAETARRRIIPIFLEPLAHERLPLNLRQRHYLRMDEDEGMALHTLVTDLGGVTIPRIVNLSGHRDLKTANALMLAEGPFQRVDLTDPDALTAYGIDLARFALPYIQQATAGIVLPGHSAVAGVTLAYLLGTYNTMPQIYVPQQIATGHFQVDGTKPIVLQAVRNDGFRDRAGG